MKKDFKNTAQTMLSVGGNAVAFLATAVSGASVFAPQTLSHMTSGFFTNYPHPPASLLFYGISLGLPMLAQKAPTTKIGKKIAHITNNVRSGLNGSLTVGITAYALFSAAKDYICIPTNYNTFDRLSGSAIDIIGIVGFIGAIGYAIGCATLGSWVYVREKKIDKINEAPPDNRPTRCCFGVPKGP